MCDVTEEEQPVDLAQRPRVAIDREPIEERREVRRLDGVKTAHDQQAMRGARQGAARGLGRRGLRLRRGCWHEFRWGHASALNGRRRRSRGPRCRRDPLFGLIPSSWRVGRATQLAGHLSSPSVVLSDRNPGPGGSSAVPEASDVGQLRCRPPNPVDRPTSSDAVASRTPDMAGPARRGAVGTGSATSGRPAQLGAAGPGGPRARRDRRSRRNRNPAQPG